MHGLLKKLLVIIMQQIKHIHPVKRIPCPRPEIKPYWGDTLVELPLSLWPQPRTVGTFPFKVWISNQFIVQVFNEKNGIMRVSVRRNDGRDGITWDSLQSIKAEIGYSDYQAFECYPKAHDVVNVANMRHLFIMPMQLNISIGWIKQNIESALNPFTLYIDKDNLQKAVEELKAQVPVWTVIEDEGHPKYDGQYYVVFHTGNPKNQKQMSLFFLARQGWVNKPDSMVVTHYISAVALPTVTH